MSGYHAIPKNDDNLTWQLSKYTATLPQPETLASGINLVVQRSRQLLLIYGGDRILQQVHLSAPFVEINSRNRDYAISVTTKVGNLPYPTTRFRFRVLNENDFLRLLGVLSTFTNVVPVGPSRTATSIDSQFSQMPSQQSQLAQFSQLPSHQSQLAQFSQLPSQQSQLTSQESCFDTFGGFSQNCYTPPNNNGSVPQWASSPSGSSNTSFQSCNTWSTDMMSPFKPTFSSTQKTATQTSQQNYVDRNSQSTSIHSSSSSAAMIDTPTQLAFTPPSMNYTASRISVADLKKHMQAAKNDPKFMALVKGMTEIMKQPGWAKPQSEHENKQNPKFIPPKRRSSKDLSADFSQSQSQARKGYK